MYIRFVVSATFLVAIIAQAVWPQRRLQIVLTGAVTCAAVACGAGVLDMATLWKAIPWAVIVILVCLNGLTQAIVPSNILGRLAVATCTQSRGSELGLLIIFPTLMFLLSAVVNNLTAMLIVMPILLTILKVLGPSDRLRNLLISALLVSCNLGGAASPIGDFPAVLLLGYGRINFISYLIRAGVVCAVIFIVVQMAFIAWHLLTGANRKSSIEQRLAVETIRRLYRRTRINWTTLSPAAVTFVAMIIAWSAGVSPDLVAIVGTVVVLVFAGARAETIIRRGIEVEPVLYLIGLFMMIAIIDAAGVLDLVATPIFNFASSPRLMISAFLILAGVLTGIFSAGPSMAALLPLADKMTAYVPADSVYVGLALSVCAGSSLFLTAATSGPLAQCQVEAAQLPRDDGGTAAFDFLHFVPRGIVAFAIIQAGAIVFVLLTT